MSAHLDGEQHDEFDTHFDGCTDCQAWFDRAAMVTRLTRIGLTVPSVGVPESVLDAAPKPLGKQLMTIMYVALGAIGAAQLLLAVAQIAGAAMVGMSTLGSTQGATPSHLLHETAAWNIGVGVAFLLIAGGFVRPASMVGILSAFVAALLLFSAADLVDGAVAWSRLASHLLLVVGYVLVVVLSRKRFRHDEPPTVGGWGSSRWHLTPVPKTPLPTQFNRGIATIRQDWREVA